MNISKQVVRLGIDLGKNTFHLFDVNSAGNEVLRKKLNRAKLLSYTRSHAPAWECIPTSKSRKTKKWAETATKSPTPTTPIS
jgi:hypothetical protein